jgi:hypothetical protein
MKTFGGWTGLWIVLALFLANEFLGTIGSAMYICFPIGRLFVIPVACVVQIFVTFATTTKISGLPPAAISALVLAYQFFGPPLRTVFTLSRSIG